VKQKTNFVASAATLIQDIRHTVCLH